MPSSAFYSTLFPLESEAAFSNYRLWESAGFIAACAWSFYLCTSVKLYITMAFFYVGCVLFYVTYAKMRLVKDKWVVPTPEESPKEAKGVENRSFDARF